jgi:hypothetical protein
MGKADDSQPKPKPQPQPFWGVYPNRIYPAILGWINQLFCINSDVNELCASTQTRNAINQTNSRSIYDSEN